MREVAYKQLKTFLSRLMRREDLSVTEASAFLQALSDNRATDNQIVASLIAMVLKGETIEELGGMVAALREDAAIIISKHERMIGIADTGLNASKPFNLFTAAAIVVAGAGLPVVRQINSGYSRFGKDLEDLGVRVDASSEIAEACLNDLGICFISARSYHPLVKRIADVRQDIGVATTFNLLEALLNPAGSLHHIIGVWHVGLIKPCARALIKLGVERAWVVHGMDGLDTVTISDNTIVAEAYRGKVTTFELMPEDFGVQRSSFQHLYHAGAEMNTGITRAVLKGERRDRARSLVVVNAAACLFFSRACSSLKESVKRAEESIDSGADYAKLLQLAEATNSE
jgi:anthranilate phosphoribosyltransferase